MVNELNKIFTVADQNQMSKLGGKFAGVCIPGMVIYLYGELGVGKTTWVRGFIQSLGYLGVVRSSTFNLFEFYEVAGKNIVHFDLYRLNQAQELEYIGIQDYFDSDNIILVEWPEHGASYLPDADLSCYFDFLSVDNLRVVKVQSNSDRGKQILGLVADNV